MEKKSNTKKEVVSKNLNIKNLAKEINKENKNSAVKTMDDEISSDIKYCYPFNDAVIDIPMGGGICGGKIYEFYGWESVGKSTLCLEIAKQFCNYWESQGEENYLVVWMEAESALDRVRAKWMGVPIDTKFLIFEARTIEESKDLIRTVLGRAKASNFKVLFVWDTIAATPTLKEKEVGQYGGGMMEKPRAVRQMFRDIVDDIGDTHSSLILVNQFISTTNPHKPNDTAIPAIKFYASVRGALSARHHKEMTAHGDDITPGIWTTIKYDKNKLIQRGQTSQIYIDNEKGFDHVKTVINYLKRAKLIDMAGSWKTINLPKRPFKKGEEIEYVEFKFQNDDKISEAIETQYNHLYDWMNYLIYRNYTTVSPLIKVKIIRKVWEYEKYFFGKKQTQLTAEEKEVAKMLIKNQNELQDKEIGKA